MTSKEFAENYTRDMCCDAEWYEVYSEQTCPYCKEIPVNERHSCVIFEKWLEQEVK